MKVRTFRIGGRDYSVSGYAGSHKVRIKKLAREGEVQEGSRDFDSTEEATKAIQMESLDGYKKIVLDMPAAHSVSQDQDVDWNSRFAMSHNLYTDNGKAKSAGFMVIISKEEDLQKAEHFQSVYCRGKKAVDEVTLESVLMPEVIETTEFDAGQMFYLDHGMSWERWMSM